MTRSRICSKFPFFNGQSKQTNFSVVHLIICHIYMQIGDEFPVVQFGALFGNNHFHFIH